MNGAGRFWFQWPCILFSIPFNWSFSPFLNWFSNETSPVRQRTDSPGRGWRRCANRVVAARAAGTAARVIAGAGDDCAIVESQGKKNLLVLKTDCVVEKIHFAPATDQFTSAGKR